MSGLERLQEIRRLTFLSQEAVRRNDKPLATERLQTAMSYCDQAIAATVIGDTND